jgi:hypothetical protein
MWSVYPQLTFTFSLPSIYWIINSIPRSRTQWETISDCYNATILMLPVERFGYHASDIVMLTDDAQDPRSIPTKANIMQAMGWLVAGAAKDDSLFFH